jgi:CheY-like chemotaxis protein
MARELLSQIFEPFFQGPAAVEQRNPGMGLGLTLVRALVEMHGGTVLAESDGPGKGSTLTVELPPSREEAKERKPPADGPDADRPRATDLKILIVEDNSDTRDMMKMLLESYGYAVVTAGDGRSALEVLETKRPDVALVDIGLPEVDGYEVARRARRQRPDGSGAYLVALTGYGRPADRKKAQEAGFDDHLTKPVDMDAIWKVLEAAGRRRD